VHGTVVPNGAKVPGTQFQLDPVQAAFNIGTMIRWLDFNDTWLAAEWGHPSDNLGGILATADWLARSAVANGKGPLLMREVLTAMIKAHEIQGVTALENSFNRVGLDHVLLVRVASTAVATTMLGGTRDQVINALSNAWIDGGALRTYRHAPNTGSRKSWAAGDATSRAVRHALIALTGEMGYPSALSAKTWGFQDVLFNGKPLVYSRPFDSYVMENVLFKISFPAEFHAQTAVEAALLVREQVLNAEGPRSLAGIAEVEIGSYGVAIEIIGRDEAKWHPRTRETADHSFPYCVAVALLDGTVTVRSFGTTRLTDPVLHALMQKIRVVEQPEFIEWYPQAMPTRVTVRTAAGKEYVRQVDFPLGHPRNPMSDREVEEKFRSLAQGKLDRARAGRVIDVVWRLDALKNVGDLMPLLRVKG